MDERRRYVVIEVSFEDKEDRYETIRELEDHLQMNGYDYFLTCDPLFREIMVLLINDEQTGYIDTVLEDREIKFEYR